MYKTVIAIPVVALLGLAACTSYEPLPPATGTILAPSAAVTTAPTAPIAVVPAPGTTVVQGPAVVQTPVVTAFRPGRGVIDAVVAMNVPMSATAGGSSIATARVYRLTLRMDDGTFQTLDQDNAAFRPGDRVEVTRDGHIVR